MIKSNLSYFSKTSSAAPLAIFRIIFGIMMLLGIIRFWALGWIDKLYIDPSFFFSYYGFEWVKPLGTLTYLLFFVCGLSAFFVAIGFKYRIAIITFFLSFLYIELMDKTTYLNHYYFISLLSFLLLFLPAGNYFSIDAKRNPTLSFNIIPKWNIDAIKLLLAIVYFYAGLAKLNSDWLIHAMPLKIWLPTTNDLPIIGHLFQYKPMIYIFSWSGALYDLLIPFLLYYSKTRNLAFVLVVLFHLLTAALFPIGMFPYIMILSALIFFDAKVHQKIIDKLSGILGILNQPTKEDKGFQFKPSAWNKIKGTVLITFFIVQLLFPFRHVAYTQELFWTEEGYRFSWRVMLMEKAGYAQFKIVNGETGSWFYIDNSEFLSPFQEKQMATQPDFILEYAHFLEKHFSSQGHQDISVFVDSFVALNGRKSARYIDPKVDLTKERESFAPKKWILPFNDKILGL
jgi:hypothetical protein